MKFTTILVLSLAAVAFSGSVFPMGDEAGECCSSCTAPLEKYYSVNKLFGFCGECCMDPKDFWKVPFLSTNSNL